MYFLKLLSSQRPCHVPPNPVLERNPLPRPLRDDRFPRGLPTLSGAELQRVELDNEASDFALALQQWGNEYGLGCLRENPLNSLHWKDPVECSLWSDGSWFDTLYDACVFMGARKKAQRLRHNIPEISMLPSLRCGHVHSPNEWSRTSSGFPTFAESEYTPSLVFTIAVAATAWAKKMGWACESIPRLPPIHVTGDVRGLLEFPPEFLRSDLMLVTALHLEFPVAKLPQTSRIRSSQPITSTLDQGTFLIVGQWATGPIPSSQVGTAPHSRPSFVTCIGFKTNQHCFQSCINFGDKPWSVIVLILNFVMETSLQQWSGRLSHLLRVVQQSVVLLVGSWLLPAAPEWYHPCPSLSVKKQSSLPFNLAVSPSTGTSSSFLSLKTFFWILVLWPFAIGARNIVFIRDSLLDLVLYHNVSDPCSVWHLEFKQAPEPPAKRHHL